MKDWYIPSGKFAMSAVIQNLLNLQVLEFAETVGKSARSEIAELRAEIPAPVLGHYDRLRVRGKKSVAVVRNQTCTGCYMRQPIGKIAVLMRNEDVQLCDSCGRYLYLPSPVEETVPVAVTVEAKPEKPAPKPRKRKAAATVAA